MSWDRNICRANQSSRTRSSARPARTSLVDCDPACPPPLAESAQIHSPQASIHLPPSSRNFRIHLRRCRRRGSAFWTMELLSLPLMHGQIEVLRLHNANVADPFLEPGLLHVGIHQGRLLFLCQAGHALYGSCSGQDGCKHVVTTNHCESANIRTLQQLHMRTRGSYHVAVQACRE